MITIDGQDIWVVAVFQRRLRSTYDEAAKQKQPIVVITVAIRSQVAWDNESAVQSQFSIWI